MPSILLPRHTIHFLIVHLLVSTLLVPLLAIPASALPPQAEIHAVDHAGVNPSVTGMAPFAVHVDALETTLGAGTPLTARYQWDFGDTTAGSRFNTLDGWVAAHLYEAAGSYTLTLTVTNEDGDSDSQQISVEVLADTRTRIHVANGGDDANDGQTPLSAVRSLARAQSLLASNTMVLFRRGETHDFASAQLILEGVANVVVGAYGEGERPILLGPAYNPAFERTLLEIINPYQGMGPPAPTNRDIVVRDLSWRTPTPSSPAVEFNHIAMQAHGRDNYNLSFVNNHCDDVGSCVQTSSGNWPQDLDRGLGSGILLLDNVHEESTRYFTFFATSHTTLLGNRSILGSHTSFIFRFYADRVLIAHNDFQQPAGDREEFAIAGGNHCNVETGQLLADCEPAHGDQQWGEYAYLAHNRLDGTLRLGYEDRDSYYRWIVLDSNRFTRSAANQSPTPTLRHFPHTRNMVLRNNVFEGPGGTTAFSTTGVDDITLAHNTGLSPTNENSFVQFFPATAPPAGAYTFVHNLWLSRNTNRVFSAAFPTPCGSRTPTWPA